MRATVVTDAVADEREDHMETVLSLLVGDRQASLAEVDEVLSHWDPAAPPEGTGESAPG